jgi:hypothetical protein
MVDPCSPFVEKTIHRDLHQKKLNQSPNGLKKKQDFHIWMLLLKTVTG